MIKSSGVRVNALVCTTVRVVFAAPPAPEEACAAASSASPDAENRLVVQLMTLEKNEVTSGTYPLEPCCAASTAGAVFSWSALPLDFLRFALLGLDESRADFALNFPLSSGLLGSILAAREVRRRALDDECMLPSTSDALRLRRRAGAVDAVEVMG